MHKSESITNEKNEIEKEVEHINTQNQSQQLRIDKLEQILEVQRQDLAKRQTDIKHYFERKKERQAEEERKRQALQLIQLRFEQWYNLVGHTKKKKKRRRGR